ncbi:alpha/beta hydrolase [Erythrobacter sp.]|uniref:alpha/beta hydrolase n=1 Tax=Erythrobacter sp. TaxID=1042 RepID=UPI0014260060|nr:alpha/beta hydrolase [Erythrobacter sp.]QIQ85827.1 MAG: alpha/beta hydrolase [Erythrobacter sp.]
MQERTFADSRSWAEYRAILARAFGLAFPCEPDERFREMRGHRVRYDLWESVGETQGTLVLVHGGGGNGRVLAPAALPALAAGWRVVAPDLPGYGLTAPAPGFDWDIAEWPRVVADFARAEPGPVVLMGLSLGGMVAALAAEAEQRVAGVIATTLVDPSDPAIFDRIARWRWLGRASRVAFRLAPGLVDRLRLPLALATPLAAMTSDPELARWFARDPLIGRRRIPARFFRSIHEAAPARRLSCPLLLVHPGADAWTPTALSLPAFEPLRAPDKRLVELTNGAHLPLEQPAFAELGAAVRSFLHKIALA